MSQSAADRVSAGRTASDSLLRAALKTVASLWLTVGLLFFLIAVLLWGTVTEKYFGAAAAKFGIYGSWWFNALGFALAVNSLASLVLRLPWKRQHLGFILPHLGLVVLLVGCYVSRRYGIEANLSIVEGQKADHAYEGAQFAELDGGQWFKLQVADEKSGSQNADDGKEGDAKEGDKDKAVQNARMRTIEVPFTSGPFNWEDYTNGRLTYLPWSLARRDGGVLYDQGGIRLEVLDYLSNSELVHLPALTVEAVPAADGREVPEAAKLLKLEVKSDGEVEHAMPSPFGIGDAQAGPGGANVMFWMTGSEGETAAFRASAPKGPLGKRGVLVLFAAGEAMEFPLDDWRPGTRRKLGGSGLEAKLAGFDVTETGNVAVGLEIYKGDAMERMIVSAESPQAVRMPDYTDAVYGTYWLPRPNKSDSEKSKAAEADKGASADKENNDAEENPLAKLPPLPPRVEFLQGADHKLYLRTWRDGVVAVRGPLRFGNGGMGRITVFPKTADAMVLRFGNFSPADEPTIVPRPVAFNKDPNFRRLRQARVKLTVDGHSDEFWVLCSGAAYDPEEKSVYHAMKLPSMCFEHSIAGTDRNVTLSFEPQSFQIGYTVRLNKAWRKLDPGAPGRAAESFFASQIDLLPNVVAGDETAAGRLAATPPTFKDQRVTLNAPLDFTDPRSGKSFRMFQENMAPPQAPQQFGINMGPEVCLSGLTLNHDPGRGLKYVGCLMVVAGIFVAYFVRIPPARRKAA